MKATDLLDRKLSGGEKRSKEAHVKKLKKHKGDFEKRYGDDAESVMYAVATKRAKGEGIEENPVGQYGKFVNNHFEDHKLDVAKWLMKQDKHSQLEEIEHLMDKAYPNGSDDRFYKEWEKVVGPNPLPWQSTGVNPPREEGIEDIAKSHTKRHTLPRIDTDKYQERDGLEGPIATRSGKVVYYDNKEGKYYDPDKDMYIDHEDMRALTLPQHTGRVREVSEEARPSKSITFKADDGMVELYTWNGVQANLEDQTTSPESLVKTLVDLNIPKDIQIYNTDSIDLASHHGFDSDDDAHNIINKAIKLWSSVKEDNFDAEGQQGRALMQLYKDNEHNNYHSENNLLLAKAFGTPKEVNMVELIIKKNQKQGHTSHEDFDWMHKNINKKYYKELVKGALDENYGSLMTVGMNPKPKYKDEKDSKYKIGLTKKPKNAKEPYIAKKESIFDETWKMEEDGNYDIDQADTRVALSEYYIDGRLYDDILEAFKNEHGEGYYEDWVITANKTGNGDE